MLLERNRNVNTAQSKKLLVGFLFLGIGLLLISKHGRSSIDYSSYTFAQEPVQIQGFEIRESVTRKPNRIIIPELSIDIGVSEANVINGYWEVYENIAGWGQGSGVPGEIGNQVIFAHARENLFLPLKDIEKDMSIYVLASKEANSESDGIDISDVENDTQTRNSWYEYQISEIREVFPYETDIISPTSDETLTLYTCSGFGDEKRLIVVSKRVS